MDSLRKLTCRNGSTIVELMVTIVIVAVLAATVGMFFVKLLTLQEQEREEAYIREKLADICGLSADWISVGSGFFVSTNASDRSVVIHYRQETGGISLETGVVSRASHLKTEVGTNLNITVYSTEPVAEAIPRQTLLEEEVHKKMVRNVVGDAYLLPLSGEVVALTLRPLNVKTNSQIGAYGTSDAALGLLEVVAKYKVKNNAGELEERSAKVERVVRLWNRE